MENGVIIYGRDRYRGTVIIAIIVTGLQQIVDDISIRLCLPGIWDVQETFTVASAAGEGTERETSTPCYLALQC